MAKLETEHVFEGDIKTVFGAINNFALYPDYIPGVTAIEVLAPKAEGSIAQVRYELNIIKKFFYTLDMFAEEPNKIWWTLADSNLMKTNNGSWEFKSKGKTKTHADYMLDIKFKGLVPGKITDQIAKANLGGMFEGFQKLIKENS